jgi:hypothetical protein
MLPQSILTAMADAVTSERTRARYAAGRIQPCGRPGLRGQAKALRCARTAAITPALEQDRFRLDHVASITTWRLKRESCSIHRLESKIHVCDRSEKLRSQTILL